MGEEPDLDAVKQLMALKEEWGKAADPAAQRSRLAQDPVALDRPGVHDRHRLGRRAARRRLQQAEERARARHLQLRSGRLFRHVSAGHVLAQRE